MDPVRSVSNHLLIQNAGVMRSDYPIVSAAIDVWARFINLQIAGCRPVLWTFSQVSHSHAAYKREIEAIDLLSPSDAKVIRSATEVFGGETADDFSKLEARFDAAKHLFPKFNTTKVTYYCHSDSLKAARAHRENQPGSKIVITNFANAVRVGGADRSGGRGSQEEHLMRASYLRISLEEAARQVTERKSDRYIGYYSAVMSKNVPTIGKPDEKFDYVSSAAPDLRTGWRSEGNYFKAQKDKDALVKEVLKRKLSVIMMSAALSDHDVVVLGAFGCGAFGNQPKMVSEVVEELLKKKQFSGLFKEIIFPIGTSDPNYKDFKKLNTS